MIVLGVLEALLAESAWQERGERVEERTALDRIREDLALDAGDLRNDERWLAMAQAAAEEAEFTLAGADSRSDEARVAVVCGAVLVNTVRMADGTWQDLTAAGRFDLVSDPVLRRRLINCFATRRQREEWRDDIPATLRSRVLSVLPVDDAQVVLDQGVRGAEGFDLDRIRSFPDKDLELRALRYGLRGFGEQPGATRAAFDSVVPALDRTAAGTR